MTYQKNDIQYTYTYIADIFPKDNLMKRKRKKYLKKKKNNREMVEKTVLILLVLYTHIYIYIYTPRKGDDLKENSFLSTPKEV